MTTQDLIQKRREEATTKDEIDFLAQLKTSADADRKNFQDLAKQKDDILKDYKEAILHTSFPRQEKEPIEEQKRKPVKTFDEIINENFSKLK